jgi:NAD(P)H dehydrogenase (quinone)
LVYALEQRESYKSGQLSPDIQAEIEKLKWCDLLIFNFPMYWFSVPAIMKGWIDRVFVSGLCYGGKRFYDQGGLKGKKSLLAFTLGGREHMFGKDKIHGEIQTMLRPLMRGSMAYVGLSVLPPFIGWHVPYISDEDRHSLLEQYQTYLTNLDQLDPLIFPSLDDFDEKMMPKK